MKRFVPSRPQPAPRPCPILGNSDESHLIVCENKTIAFEPLLFQAQNSTATFEVGAESTRVNQVSTSLSETDCPTNTGR
jgi:hypothetical protein